MINPVRLIQLGITGIKGLETQIISGRNIDLFSGFRILGLMSVPVFGIKLAQSIQTNLFARLQLCDNLFLDRIQYRARLFLGNTGLFGRGIRQILIVRTPRRLYESHNQHGCQHHPFIHIVLHVWILADLSIPELDLPDQIP